VASTSQLVFEPNRSQVLVARLKAITGSRHVLTGPAETKPYRQGFRFGSGKALAVVRPGSLVALWRVLEACVEHNTIVIMQAANTGLTGGSTPHGDTYDRDIVVISTMRLKGVQLINDGAQVVCQPGATLYELEDALRPLNREPHSVIGSSCIGASVLGGISNNSGGALVQRGPAYTEMALYAQVDADGTLRLVNHLGIALGETPEEMLDRLQRGAYDKEDIDNSTGARASDNDYRHHVRDVDADTPARFNADARRLFEASGNAGKLCVFAVRLDTFAKAENTAVFYIGTNDPGELTALRRHMLANLATLPVAGEYLHRTAFDIAARYGKDMFLAIHHLGTSRIPGLFRFKARIDRFAERFSWLPKHASDRIMQAISALFPQHLPARMIDYRHRYEHHLLLKVSGDGIDEARSYLASIFPSNEGAFFECTKEEGDKAFLHRFAAAGAAIRFRTLNDDTVEDIVALDIALRRNDAGWVEHLPEPLSRQVSHALYYGHFFCHVFHQDYIVRKGHDPMRLEHDMLALLDGRGARYPAEHNVGHLYHAPENQTEFYRRLDAKNMFNPGIGCTSKGCGWT
jgi:D-lactate dehydrogenase